MAHYAELHVTTNYSFLRGGSHPGELVAQAALLGHEAIAITDRHTLAGLVRAHVEAKEHGIRLIVGARLDTDDGHNLLVYPTDLAAYGRLTRLLTLGNRRAGKGECVLSFDDVATHAEGLMAVVLPPRHAEDPAFVARLRQAATLFGNRCHLAASVLRRGDDARRLTMLDDLAARTGVALVATNDVHYHEPGRRALQDVLTAIRLGRTVDRLGFHRFAGAERHLKPVEEMARLFRRHPHAIDNALALADRCRFSLDELRYRYPVEAESGKTPQAKLTRLAWEGAARRYSDGVPPKVADAIRHELTLIAELDYAPYFLTVHEIVEYARSRDILCQGRGSAANSTVCYCMGITAVDPTKVDLLFERFVSSSRGEPPDIDVDFEHERREEVIQWIYARYGRERAGLAATVIAYRSRSAIRDVGKALGLSPDAVGALADTVWGSGSGGVDPAHVRESGLDPQDRRLAMALDLSATLCGFPRHLSQHVGGFVIAAERLDELVPIQNAAMADRTVVEWDKDDLDALKMLKIDVLALGMLTCIRKGFDLIRAHHGRSLTLATVPPEDPAVYEMLCRADSVGVFQVESRAQMSMLPRLRPKNFYDLVIQVAIVRPGPIQGDMVHPYLRRRHGLEKVEYPSEELRAVLGKTMGVPLFQEQAMKIAIVAAGFTPGEADQLRRAMATFRHTGKIHTFRTKLVEGMVARGYERDFAERCFRQIEGFGEYGFPESHAASFALLVYVSSWIKCYYPDAFACALLNSQPMGFYAPAQLVRDAREHGVLVLPPDINRSDWDNTLEAVPAAAKGEGHRDVGAEKVDPSSSLPPCGGGLGWGVGPTPMPRDEIPPPRPSPTRGEGERSGNAGHVPAPGVAPPHPLALRLGLRQIESVGEEAMRRLVERRGTGYRDVADLWRRSGLNRRQIEALARADAFGSLGLSRRDVLWAARALRDDRLPLFDGLPDLPAKPAAAPAEGIEDDDPPDHEPAVALPTLSLGEQVVDDYASIAMSLRSHPLALVRATLDGHGVAPHATLSAMRDGARVSVCGLVLVRQRPGTASGVVFMTLEDETGVSNVVVWKDLFDRSRRVVMGARLLRVEGVLQREGEVIHVVARRLTDESALLDSIGTPDGPGAADGPRPSTHLATAEARATRHRASRGIVPPVAPGDEARSDRGDQRQREIPGAPVPPDTPRANRFLDRPAIRVVSRDFH